MKYLLEILIFLFFSILLILFIQISNIPIRIKLIVIDLLFIGICIKYRCYRTISKDKSDVLFTIQWYGLLGFIIILSIAIIFM